MVTQTRTCLLYGTQAGMLHSSATTGHLKKKKKQERKSNKNLSSISSQSGLWTSLLLPPLLLFNAWDVNTSHTSTVECWVSKQLTEVKRESGFRHWCLKFHTWGVSLHACANDWPWRSRVAVCAGGQRGRNAARDCDCLDWRNAAGAVLPWSLRVRHAFQTATKKIICFPGR